MEEKVLKYQEMPTEDRRVMEAKLMLYMNKLGVKEIAAYTGLSIDEVEALQDAAENAESAYEAIK
mgnify:CR=1 FL=1